MSSIYSYVFFPVRSRTLEHFAAPDPWHGGKPANWTFEIFLMVRPIMEQIYREGKRPVPQTGEGARLGKSEVLGIRNAAEGRLRQLPFALSQLWQEGAVKTKDLPRLMAAVEGNLAPRDYFFPHARLFKVLYIYVVVVALLFMIPSALAGITFFLWLLGAVLAAGAYNLYGLHQWKLRAAQTRADVLKLA